jgi:amino acid permease
MANGGGYVAASHVVDKDGFSGLGVILTLPVIAFSFVAHESMPRIQRIAMLRAVA